MLIFPYSTALSLARPPWVCYGAAALCVLVFMLQLGTPVTESLLYYPDSWNPIRMVSSSLAHAGFLHLAGNLVFFLAFAPALEIIVANPIRFAGILLLVAIVTSASYSLWTALTGDPNIPSLGFSGVVTGMIGLAAFLMPRARIRVFFWLIVWKTFYVPAWILAAIYIGVDAWTMFAQGNQGGINLVAHVSGGVAGFAYGWFRLGERKAEIGEELADEIEAMAIEQRHGKTRAQAHRYQKRTAPLEAEREKQRQEDRYLHHVYRLVQADRNADAIMELLERYGDSTLYTELEALFERVAEWGPSRTQLCLGRQIIDLLDRERRYGRALMMIERCQAVSPKFVLPDVRRTQFYAEMAIDTGKAPVAVRLLEDAAKRYAGLLNVEQCRHLWQQARRQSGQAV